MAAVPYIKYSELDEFYTIKEVCKLFQMEKSTLKHRFRCKICGYVYEGDALPEDYKCPLCGAGAEYFRQEA